MVLLAGGAVAAAPSSAHAISIWGSDCNFGFQEVYNAGEPVCVTGELDVVPPGAICGEAYVIVRPAGHPVPFFDITAGGANYIQGCSGAGAFFDEYVWLPPLKPGQYDLVIDQWPFFGGFGTEDYEALNAISVSNAPLIQGFDSQAVKDAAEDGLAYAQALADLVLALTVLDTLSTAADWAQVFGGGGALAGIALGYICYKKNWDCPTSYNSAVITIGNKIIKHQSDALFLHYGAIVADPPDPAFDVVVPLELNDALASGPWTPGAGASIPTRHMAVARALSLQAAAYEALLPSVEKLQGAEAAHSHTGLLVQSEKVLSYVDLALASGDAMLVELDALESELTAAGVYANEVPMKDAIEILASDGLTPEEEDFIMSFGATVADFDEAMAEYGDTPVPDSVSWQAFVETARGTYEAARPGLLTTIDNVEAIRAENEPYALRLSPVVEITGSTSGNVGTSMQLSASAEHLNPDATITLSWDFDGDGDFDDGTGATVDFTPTLPGLVPVSVQADDGVYIDVKHHLITVGVSNVPPELTVVEPETAPFADVDEMVPLHVEATDADGDPLTYTWSVDGTEAGTGQDLPFTMPDEEVHQVTVTVADDDMYSPDATFTFWVRASKWQSGGGDDGGPDGTGDGAEGGADAAEDGTAGGDAADAGDGTAGGGSDGTGGADGADGGGAGGGGCGCTTDTPSNPLPLLLLLLTLPRRRRRSATAG